MPRSGLAGQGLERLLSSSSSSPRWPHAGEQYRQSASTEDAAAHGGHTRASLPLPPSRRGCTPGKMVRPTCTFWFWLGVHNPLNCLIFLSFFIYLFILWGRGWPQSSCKDPTFAGQPGLCKELQGSPDCRVSPGPQNNSNKESFSHARGWDALVFWCRKGDSCMASTPGRSGII